MDECILLRQKKELNVATCIDNNQKGFGLKNQRFGNSNKFVKVSGYVFMNFTIHTTTLQTKHLQETSMPYIPIKTSLQRLTFYTLETKGIEFNCFDVTKCKNNKKSAIYFHQNMLTFPGT